MNTTEQWPRCREAASFFESLLAAFLSANSPVGAIASRFLERAGVRLFNLVDHWALPEAPGLVEQMAEIGLVETVTSDGDAAWEHPRARLPRIRLEPNLTSPCLALGVEEVDRFLAANHLEASSRAGDPDSAYEEARCTLRDGELAVVARRGYRGFQPGSLSQTGAERLGRVRQAFQKRKREGEEAEVLQNLQEVVEGACGELGVARAADEFFAAEREYYMSRSRAARWQYCQQQELGPGWANHDHHTYRSSRAGFRALIKLWSTLGFIPREKFYAGEEAGWGAQILEHPVSRVVIFADLDMAPEELEIDFAETSLGPRDPLGTIGLWCELHGSSAARAGMHHLEAEFEFSRAQACLEEAGFPVMAPFTDLPMLKQAFTEAEIWTVDPRRIRSLEEHGLITPEQAERFLSHGAPGSHLEILQRWDGFKGFHKTGVSAILRETDPRRKG